MPNLEDLIDPHANAMPGSFGAAMKRPRITVPSPPGGPNTLRDLMGWIDTARAMANKNMATRQITEPLTPPLGLAMTAVMPSPGRLGQGAANATAPPPGRSLADLGMPVPENVVQSHMAQMKPLPNQGIKPTPEVAATEGMGGDAAEMLINRLMGLIK